MLPSSRWVVHKLGLNKRAKGHIYRRSVKPTHQDAGGRRASCCEVRSTFIEKCECVVHGVLVGFSNAFGHTQDVICFLLMLVV